MCAAYRPDRDLPGSASPSTPHLRARDTATKNAVEKKKKVIFTHGDVSRVKQASVTSRASKDVCIV